MRASRVLLFTIAHELSISLPTDLTITGMPKGGTSQLSSILLSHPKTVQYKKQLELCASAFAGFSPILGNNFTKDDQRKTQEGLYKFYDDQTVPIENRKNKTKLTVETCFDEADSKYIRQTS
jgi:hypothetical protein